MHNLFNKDVSLHNPFNKNISEKCLHLYDSEIPYNRIVTVQMDVWVMHYYNIIDKIKVTASVSSFAAHAKLLLLASHPCSCQTAEVQCSITDLFE